MVPTLFSGVPLFIILVAITYISDGYALSHAKRNEVKRIIRMASQHTSDFILDDLRACTYCFAYDDRYKCAPLIRAVHRIKTGVKYDTNKIADEVLPLFSERKQNYDKFICMSVRTARSSNSPYPPLPGISTDLSPIDNSEQLAISLEQEILKLVPRRVSVYYEFSVSNYSSNYQVRTKSEKPAELPNDLSGERSTFPSKERMIKPRNDFIHVRNNNVIHECGQSNCAAKVEIWSNSNIRKVIVTKAIKKLKRSIAFTDVFNPSKVIVKKTACCKFIVSVKFKERYLIDGGF